MKIKPGDYNIKEESGSIILTPLEPEVTVPRLAKAPKYTPIQVRTSEDTDWQYRQFSKYYESCCKYATVGSLNGYKQARLIPGYRYSWDPEWELFMDDDLRVKAYKRDSLQDEIGTVADIGWYAICMRTIIAFEVIES